MLRFTALTAIGSGVWNAVFVALGWWLGERWDQVEVWLGPVSYVVIGLLIVGLIVLMVRKLRSRSSASPS